MNAIAIIQARMNSTRLPGKIMIPLLGKPMLLNIIERVSRAKNLDKVVVATSDRESDAPVARFLQENSLDCFQGSLDNVLERFYLCAKQYKPKIIVRLTADNALVDPKIIDEAVETFIYKKVDYLYYKSSLPLGMCIEVFTFSALDKTYNEATDQECFEHVTPYIRNNKRLFNVLDYVDDSDTDYSNLRFTMDTQEDYVFVKTVYQHFTNNEFSYEDVLKVLEFHPEWIQINNMVVQNSISYCGEDADECQYRK